MNDYMPHPLDDNAQLRSDALDVLMDTATDLGLPFTIEEDNFIVGLPPDDSLEAQQSDPNHD